MKRIFLGTVTVSSPDGSMSAPQKISDLHVAWLRVADQSRGMDITEMSDRIDVLKKYRALPENAEYIDLENSERDLLARAAAAFRFGYADEGFLEAQKRIITANDPPPEPV